MRLGLFMMPMHDPSRDYLTTLRQDQEAVILADSLGYSEAWCGEHITSTAEPVPSSLTFFASLIDRTEQIRFASGVLNLPQMHPSYVASHVAMFDHLCEGRYIMGVGPGGLISDFEMLGLNDHKARPEMMLESIETIHKLWAGGPGYQIDNKYWPIHTHKAIYPELGIGQVLRPYQQPGPPVALSVVSPRSSTARLAGERGWLPISANFIQPRYVASHWEAYAEGCANAGRTADPSVWRIARSVLVTEDAAEAEDYMADPDGGLRFYYRYFIVTYSARGVLEMIKPDVAMPDEQVTEEIVARSMTSHGDPKSVLDQLVALADDWGPFGTLVTVGHDWDRPDMWRKSMRLMATDVLPKLEQHVGTLKAAE
jgi:alkanesulfonate monooxygenase SsuD/methylene tetrahydromethanopterin reductase-like flavin-dependent oxidoreductase (luciferase family)